MEFEGEEGDTSGENGGPFEESENNKSDSPTNNEAHNLDSDENPEDPSKEKESATQVVRFEGVADVHPVGPAAGAVAPSFPQVAGASEGAATDGSPPKSDLGDAPSPDSSSAAPAKPPAGDGDEFPISLIDIFEDEEPVDESLKNLAKSLDEVSVEELAEELQRFLQDLEGPRV